MGNSGKSKIEWTDRTWNPVVGCIRVSDGCRNCYAERMAARLASTPKAPQYGGLARHSAFGPRWTGLVRTLPEKLVEPLRWRKPRRVFVCSMSDLFHEDVPNAFIAAVFGVMAACPQHTFQVLTKRPERARWWLRATSAWADPVDAVRCFAVAEVHIRVDESNTPGWPLPNVWLGTSVEDQATADARIPELLQCPAAVRFISYEPALGPVDLSRWLPKPCRAMFFDEEAAKAYGVPVGEEVSGTLRNEPLLNWVIAGGESGPGARPAHPDWFRSVRDQCQTAGVPFFFKQWGAWRERMRGKDATMMHRVGKKAAGRELDGRAWDEFPDQHQAEARP